MLAAKAIAVSGPGEVLGLKVGMTGAEALTIIKAADAVRAHDPVWYVACHLDETPFSSLLKHLY